MAEVAGDSRGGVDRLFFLVVGSLSALAALVILVAPPARVIAVIADGSGYYMQIARNIATGRGVTFDGLHSTNGFHPLWLMTLVPLFGVVRGSSEVQFRAVGLLVTALYAVGALSFHRTLRQALSPAAAFGGGLAFAALAFLNANLMESALVLAVGSTLFEHGLRCRAQHYTPTKALVFGLLLGLAILSRLDLGFLAVGLGLLDLARMSRVPERRRHVLVRLVLIVVAASVVVLPYLAYNQLAFGSVVPLSGRLESTLPRMNPIGLRMARALGSYRALVLVPAAFYLIAYVVGLLRGGPREAPALRYVRRSVALLAVVGLVHTAHELLFMKWQLYWHSVILLPLGGGLVALGCQRLVDRFPRRSPLAVAMALTAPAILVYGVASVRRHMSDLASEWRVQAYEAALFLRAHTAPDARVAMRIAEVTGFFAERQTVDLEGLCNGLELQSAIREQRLHGYLQAAGVTYLVDLGLSSDFEIAAGERERGPDGYERGALYYPSELHAGVSSEPVPVRRVDEVWRSRRYFDQGRPCQVVVWRIAPSSDPG